MNKANECSPAEAEEILARMIGRVTGPKITVKGFIDAVCKNDDGSVAWECHKSNLITDWGRKWMLYHRGSGLISRPMVLFTSSVTAPASAKIAMLRDAGTSPYLSQVSGGLTATYNSTTRTNTFANTFASPGSARNIACIGLGSNDGTPGVTAYGTGVISGVIAYTTLPVVKTQNPGQTLEVQYQITFNASI